MSYMDSDVRNSRGRSGGQRRGIEEKCQQMQVDGKVEEEQVNTKVRGLRGELRVSERGTGLTNSALSSKSPTAGLILYVFVRGLVGLRLDAPTHTSSVLCFLAHPKKPVMIKRTVSGTFASVEWRETRFELPKRKNVDYAVCQRVGASKLVHEMP
ncbi:hypothetical protein QQF64_010870 [Cirrhinus molitorella]|uniref:Uncharacterized protein n=1 Tax=Cirrhinus molitorella TaxID=172907 RepID=A0ABR3M019_9TELE